MQTINLQKAKILLWILLVLSLVFYIAGEGFLQAGAAAKNAETQAENGMGGGTDPGNLHLAHYTELLPEFNEIHEHIEYSRPRMLAFSSYTLKSGDMIGQIAIRAGLNEDTLISVNKITNTRLMQIGQVIRIPNQDGIYYSVKNGETLESIAENYNTSVSNISTVNELFTDNLRPNDTLFIPGARMDWVARQ